MIKKIDIEDKFIGYEVGQYLKEEYGYSSRRLRNLEIYLNGKRLKNNSKKIKKNSKLLIKEVQKSTGIKPMEMKLDIAYEDDNLLLINKPPYIIVHPTQKKVDKTLANGVVNYFLKTMGKIIVPRFYNRLDMNTSGIIIVTKNAHSQTYLQEKGIVNKYYKAIVKGIIKEDDFIIEKPIGKVGDELRRVELLPKDGGQEAKTQIKVLERFENKNLTLVEARLFTGRTHQIRAHLSLMGYPILGDELYGGADNRAERQMLHSYKTEFSNPKTFKLERVEVALPKDMKEILNICD